MKDRLESHLFYKQNSAYKSCLKIKLKNKKYNINIFNRNLYLDGLLQKNVKLPNWNWFVIKIPLLNSNQAIREMFETAFDKEYGKPIYSDR